MQSIMKLCTKLSCISALVVTFSSFFETMKSPSQLTSTEFASTVSARAQFSSNSRQSTLNVKSTKEADNKDSDGSDSDDDSNVDQPNLYSSQWARVSSLASSSNDYHDSDVDTKRLINRPSSIDRSEIQNRLQRRFNTNRHLHYRSSQLDDESDIDDAFANSDSTQKTTKTTKQGVGCSISCNACGSTTTVDSITTKPSNDSENDQFDEYADVDSVAAGSSTRTRDKFSPIEQALGDSVTSCCCAHASDVDESAIVASRTNLQSAAAGVGKSKGKSKDEQAKATSLDEPDEDAFIDSIESSPQPSGSGLTTHFYTHSTGGSSDTAKAVSLDDDDDDDDDYAFTNSDTRTTTTKKGDGCGFKIGCNCGGSTTVVDSVVSKPKPPANE